MDRCEEIRHRIGTKAIYDLRKETIERIFCTAKENYGMHYTQEIGKKKMSMKVGLTFACLNIKKLVNLLSLRDDNPLNKGNIFRYFKILFVNLRIQEI